ncbi:hypothetical protein AOLI_G00070010 [Acnodon oligacanthus]
MPQTGQSECISVWRHELSLAEAEVASPAPSSSFCASSFVRGRRLSSCCACGCNPCWTSAPSLALKFVICRESS